MLELDMPKRVTLPLTDRAVELLRDRRIVPAHTQGEWVSRLIEEAGTRLLAEHAAKLEAEAAQIRLQSGKDKHRG
jgi:hypothetical protein